VYLPDDEVGNCALFARLLRARSEATGARYVFNCQVQAIEPSSRGVMVHAQEDYAADAVLVAAGLDSTRLLAPLGLSIPLIAVRGYSATMPIAEPSCAPRSAIMDEAFKVAVTRLGNRVRVAGTAHLGGTSTRIEEAAYRTLIRVLRDWFPGCAELSRATYWTGARPMLPDGAPLLGASSVPGVFLNLGHGSTGWAMACGSARVSCDVILGRNPEIDLEGLGVARYQRRARA
jgi:D-amino-acid dehydrogenase